MKRIEELGQVAKIRTDLTTWNSIVDEAMYASKKVLDRIRQDPSVELYLVYTMKRGRTLHGPFAGYYRAKSKRIGIYIAPMWHEEDEKALLEDFRALLKLERKGK